VVKLRFLPKKRLFAVKTDKKIVFPIFLVG
jgi:hypothetical protein